MRGVYIFDGFWDRSFPLRVMSAVPEAESENAR